VICTIPKVRSGLKELDILLGGGLPDNSVTLVYGPPKTGKSIFCYQFLFGGLSQDEPCLYVMSDYSWNQLSEAMLAFRWPVEEYASKNRIYRIDTISRLGQKIPKETETLKISQTENPTDVMLNVSSGTRFLYKKFNRFRAILDSTTSFYLYNPPQLINRVLKSYIHNIKEAQGTGIITYAQGSVDPQTETMLKATCDNLIRLDGKEMVIEAMIGLGKVKASYVIGDSGIEIKDVTDPKSFVAVGLN
jgi:KaiC/GvpD/RAD55 family RecA-like ATPase